MTSDSVEIKIRYPTDFHLYVLAEIYSFTGKGDS